jgi:hypothetical protein
MSNKNIKTSIINIIAGPSAGKTTMAALIFAELKIRGYIVEYVQEYAKKLVWLQDFETLNNQHYVSTQQYKLLRSIYGKVDFIVTDGSLLHGLYYNKLADNLSNPQKTHNKILEYYSEFNNVNIFLTRGEFDYEQAGRIQNESAAKQIDVDLKEILNAEKIEYAVYKSDKNSVNEIIDHVIKIKNVNQDKKY